MEGFDMMKDAESVISEVAYAVDEIQLSEKLEQSQNCAYINIQTKEKNNYCVQLSTQGFRIVASNFDAICIAEYSDCYETIYAMLDNVSPLYREAFGNAVASKLSALEEKSS